MSETQATEALVYLDVDDEITSAAARIRGSEAERVTLVLPYGSRLATSRINFRLLAREAGERDKRIEIVTGDASARALAAAAGLTVHPSIAAYEAARSGLDAGNGAGAVAGDGPGGVTAAHTVVIGEGAPGDAAAADDAPTQVLSIPRRKPAPVPLVGPPRPPIRTGLAVGLGLAALVVVLAGALVAIEVLPSATIVLSPRAEPIRPLGLNVLARTDVTTTDPANLVVPARRVEFDLDAATTILATGVKVTETKATGSVTFSNFDTGSGVAIPAGTIVRTKGGKDRVEFVTVADVTLPRARIDFFPPFPVQPSTGSVGIEAVEPGEEGNVGNNTITEVPGGGRNLFVTNPEATSGGERSESPEISEDDVAAAVASIADQLAADLDEQITAGAGIPPGATLFPDTKTVGTPEYSIDPQSLVGSAEAEVEVTATAVGSILVVDEAPIETVVRSRLEAEVDEGWHLDPASVELTGDPPFVAGDVVTYPFTAAGTQVRDVDQAAIIESIRGLILAEARSKLEELGDVEVSLWPAWVTTIPDNPDRITFTLGEPAFAPSPSP